MRSRRNALLALASLAAASATFAQVGRGWSDWPTPYADAQRTSWLRTDPKISVAALSQPGFELQWTAKLDNENRGLAGLTQGVTASGVTAFVPASIVAGSSNTVYLIDNDTGYVVWSRRFAANGGIASGPTRIVNAVAAPTPAPGASAAVPAGRVNQQGYRSLLGEPGQGIPVEAPAGRAGRAATPPPPAPARVTPVTAAAAAAQAGRARGANIPGAPNGGAGQVGYVISADGQLRVIGLQSGKDLQKPAPFVPANSNWTSAVAVGTMMYTATSGGSGGAPSGVFAIDLDAASKPVVSYRPNGGSVVGPVAFSSDGSTLLAAIGAGRATGEGKANAIVALDPKTLKLKDWFMQSNADFVTGPTVFRHGARDVVAAATKDGRVILLDVASLGGANHATPLAASRPLFAAGGSISAEALATWARITVAGAGSETRWVLVPFAGQPTGAPATNGEVRRGAVVALRVAETGGMFSLEPAWTSEELTTAATPIIVNGVVFALSSGRPASAGGTGSPAVLHAYDGVTGKALWNSAKAMTTFASPGSYWSSLSQIYVGTNDGTVHAFGFLDERR